MSLESVLAQFRIERLRLWHFVKPVSEKVSKVSTPEIQDTGATEDLDLPSEQASLKPIDGSVNVSKLHEYEPLPELQVILTRVPFTSCVPNSTSDLCSRDTKRKRESCDGSPPQKKKVLERTHSDLPKETSSDPKLQSPKGKQVLPDQSSKSNPKSTQEEIHSNGQDENAKPSNGEIVPSTPQARTRLLKSSIRALSIAHPNKFIDRKSQIAELKDFFLEALANRRDCKKSVYISGPPGTGKTTCVKYLLETLLPDLDSSVETAFVNCNAVGSSANIFNHIADALLPKHSNHELKNAPRFLEKELIASSRKIVLVLDEIDQLESKFQDVLYTIFEWPYLKKSKFILVGIANALDLTERILPRINVLSRFAPQEITFPAYTKDEITDILTSRLSQASPECLMIKPEAISFLASKISSQSGDIRKALDVCRRALELAELDFKKRKEDSQSKPIDPLGIPQVLRVFKELNPSTAQTAFESVPLHQQILLASAALMSFQLKVSPPINVRKLYETYCKVCKKRCLTPAGFSEVSSMITSLESRGCLATKIFKDLSSTKITLRLSVDEIETALKGRKLLDGILQDTDCIAK